MTFRLKRRQYTSRQLQQKTSQASSERADRDAQQYSNWTVDYVKDDGCGGCHGTAPDPALASYAAMQAGITESHRQIFLSTEASPNLTAHSARPDLYGNTHRTGHDSQRARPKPAWDSFAVVLVVETPVSSTLQ